MLLAADSAHAELAGLLLHDERTVVSERTLWWAVNGVSAGPDDGGKASSEGRAPSVGPFASCPRPAHSAAPTPCVCAGKK